MKLCKYCGFENGNNEFSCTVCGKPLKSEISDSYDLQQTIPPKFIPSPQSTKILRTIAPPKTVNLNTVQKVEIPFYGQNDLEISSSRGGCGIAAEREFFEVQINQRSDLELNISDQVQHESGMKCIVSIKIPNYSEIKNTEKTILENQVIPLKPLDPNAENWIRFQYSPDDLMNYGFLLMKAPGIDLNQQGVFPLISESSYSEFKQGDNISINKDMNIDWHSIEQDIQQNPIIKHTLFTREETFQWKHPLSVKAEIEPPLLSLLKTLDIFNKNNGEFLEKIGISNWNENLPEQLKEKVFGKIWGGLNKDYLGSNTAVFNNASLATFRFVLTNVTDQQVFETKLRNIELKIIFPENFKELYHPSNLRIMQPEAIKGYYDNESGVLIWDIPNLSSANSIEIEFQCLWNIIEKIDEMKIEIRGIYDDFPQLLKEYVYVSPMGFPIQINQGVSWNPGVFDEKKGKYHVDSKVVNHISNPPSFYQTITMNINNIINQYEDSLKFIKETEQPIELIKNFIKEVN